MTQAAKAVEPSMEEILASIRRIIADDDAGTAKPPDASRTRTAPQPVAVASAGTPPPPAPSLVTKSSEPPPSANPPPPADVLELTSDMEIRPNAPSFRKIEPSDDLIFDEPPPPEPEAAPAEEL